MRIVTKRKRIFWYNVLVADNGEIVMCSETYYSKYNAQRAALKLRKDTGWEIEI